MIMAEKTFSESLKKLQEAANEISKQTTSLEDALKLFDEGMKEAEFCKEILDSAKQRVQLYEDGELKDA